jgi:hypothetical protein
MPSLSHTHSHTHSYLICRPPSRWRVSLCTVEPWRKLSVLLLCSDGWGLALCSGGLPDRRRLDVFTGTVPFTWFWVRDTVAVATFRLSLHRFLVWWRLVCWSLICWRFSHWTMLYYWPVNCPLIWFVLAPVLYYRLFELAESDVVLLYTILRKKRRNPHTALDSITA